jgi:hypothetical protein
MNGFKVEKKDVSELQLDAINAKQGVPPQFRECHIALVEGYVIEGHVPVDAIRRLLKEKPPVVGLAVRGMPIGSPGMEGPNPQPYDVLAFDRLGRASVYARK